MSNKAIAYVRVSSDEQAKGGISLDAQTLAVRAYSQMRGLELVAVMREEGVSAKIALSKRPEGSRAVAALGKKGVRHIIAVKLDRLFRSAADALQQTSAWDRAEVSLHVIDMGGSSVDTRSAIGRMMLTMLAGFAEFERNLTAERTRTALRHKRQTGRVYSRVTPFGFDRHGDDLVENPAEMQTVQRIRQLQAGGLSLRKIADQLNESGTPTKLRGNWHLVTVQKVLRIHAGLPHY